jgi:hypothetical protein
VDQSAEAIASLDQSWLLGSDEMWTASWHRWRQLEYSVWPVRVVVIDVDAQDALEVPAARR